MIGRSVVLRLIAFVVVSVVGVSYVAVRYAGLGRLFGSSYTVHADFSDSGGIFTGAEVTYRGVRVGRVGPLRLRPDGVRVDLLLDGDAPPIPADARAVVADRSAVGEQYVDLQPATGARPFLQDGAVLPASRNRIPVPTETVLLNLDRVVRSVDRDHLSTVIDELGTAFTGRGPDLQRLLDSGDALLAAVRSALPQTLRLIENGRVVLATQRASGSAIRSWARDLRLLTAQLKTSDPDLRRLLANAPPAASELTALVREDRTDFGVLVANLLTVGEVTVRRLPAVRQLLVTYPVAVAGGFTVAPGDGTAHFGLVLNVGDPPACTAGYGGTTRRAPTDTRPATPNADARCTAPAGGPISVRGAQNAPRPGGPEPGAVPPPAGPAGPAAPAPAAAGPADPLPYLLGSTGGQRDLLGDRSWLALLLSGLGTG
ncbi:MAG: phospholipid/cholesterol/gamma-HCH transport system substrate-binding protein [Mycobacteriales bacterium]